MWFFHTNIQSVQPLHTAVVISLWGYVTAIEDLYLEVYQGLLYGCNYVYLLFCYTGGFGEPHLCRDETHVEEH